jgi:hypothetical protein
MDNLRFATRTRALAREHSALRARNSASARAFRSLRRANRTFHPIEALFAIPAKCVLGRQSFSEGGDAQA